ncbi:hypothetical protein Tco_0400730 [Tanacetum coccineum]
MENLYGDRSLWMIALVAHANRLKISKCNLRLSSDVTSKIQDDDDEAQTESEDDGDDFIHPKLTTHDDETTHEEETNEDDTFDPIVHTPFLVSSSDDEDSDNEVEGVDVEGEKSDEDATYVEDQGNEADRDTNANLEGRDDVKADVVLPQEVVDVAVQLKSDRIREEAQAENQQFLDSIDEGMKKLIKGEPKSRVKSRRSHHKLRSLTSIRQLYKALVDAYKADKILLDTYGDTVTLKRPRDGADDDQEPSAGTGRGSKRRSQSAPVEENMQSTDVFEAPTHQEFEIGVHDEQPEEEVHPLPDWFQQPKRLPSPDRAWNKSVPADHDPSPLSLRNLARKDKDPRASFDVLTEQHLTSQFLVMNRLNITTLTPELLAGPTFELMKGTCKSLTELQYICEEVYKAITDILDWINLEGRQYPHDLRKPLPLVPNYQVEWHNYKHLEWITVRRDDDILYKFKEGDFHRLRIQDIETCAYSSAWNVDKSQHAIDKRIKGTNEDQVELGEICWWNTNKGVNYAASKGPYDYHMLFSLIRYRYSNPMIQPEPEGSTQGYPLVSVEVLRFNTTAGNPVKKILLKLNLSDHRILKDGGGVKEFQRSFRHSDTERLSRSDEVLKLKNFKKDATLKLSKSTNQERYEHVGPEVASPQDGKVTRWRKEIVLG